MIGQLIIVLREGFEAALIISIISAYLLKTNRRALIRYVWYGVSASLVVGVLFGAAIWLFYGSLSESSQVLFEGLAAWIAVIVLSSMIYWMASKGKYLRREIERRVERVSSKNVLMGFFALSFILVFREAVETVLFLIPFMINDMSGSIIGGLIGAVISILLAYIIFILGVKIDIKRFFYFTSILLILLAGGLAGYGTHELIEYAELSGIDLSWFAEYAFILPISEDNPLHNKNIIGSILSVLFGYSTKFEWGRLLVQGAYLLLSLPSIIWIYRKE